MTEDEVHAILAQCSRRAPTGIRDRALITLMFRAGLRVHEALMLRTSDIDMKTGVVHVLHGKGDKPRDVGVGDGVLAVVQLWLDKRRELKLDGKGRPVFCTLADGRQAVSANQVRQMMKRRATKAGVERRVHPHGLRHGYASGLAQEGKPVHLIQQALGHERLSTTDTYLRKIAPGDVIAMGRADTWTDE
jgi:site-specific recombinase XerD